jgi:hypothetical protein
VSRRERPRDRHRAAGARTAAHGTPFTVAVGGDQHTRAVLVDLLAGPVIWLTHFMFVYLIAEAGCTADGPGLDIFNPPATATITLVATGVALLACVANAWRAIGRSRRAARAHEDDPVSHRDDGSLSFAGFLLSVLFFLATLGVGSSAVVFTEC